MRCKTFAHQGEHEEFVGDFFKAKTKDFFENGIKKMRQHIGIEPSGLAFNAVTLNKNNRAHNVQGRTQENLKNREGGRRAGEREPQNINR